MVLADSPLTCILCARAAFFWSSAFGRPIAWPRDRRASRAARSVRGSRWFWCFQPVSEVVEDEQLDAVQSAHLLELLLHPSGSAHGAKTRRGEG